MALSIVLSFIVAWALLAYLSTTRATKIFLDRPDHRKMHQRLVPRMGGFGVLVASLVVLSAQITSPLVQVIYVGALVLLLLGFMDDSSLPYYLKVWNMRRKGITGDVPRFEFRVRYKLLLEIALVAFTVQWLDLAPTTLSVLDFQVNMEFSTKFMVGFWILGVMNAFNLIDGIDGLCGGVAFLSFATIAYLGSVLGLPEVSLVALVIAGAALGFLVHNVAPARMFMGDMGSLFMGYAVAVLSLMLLKSPNASPDSLSVFFLAGLPVLDVFVAIYRRWRDVPAGSNVKQRLKRVVGADNNHMHHRLLYLGMGHMRAALVLYAISAIMLVGAILLVVLPVAMHAYIVGYLLISVVLCLAPIYYRSAFEKLRQGLVESLRGGSPRIWRVGVAEHTDELKASLDGIKGLPFEFVYLTREELLQSRHDSLHAVIIEQETSEAESAMLDYALKHERTWQLPMALVVSEESKGADRVTGLPGFDQLVTSATVYNRPLYTWPLLLRLLERLHERHATNLLSLLGGNSHV